MEQVRLSNHSITRGQQRGISEDLVLFLRKYGKKVNSKGNTHKFFINKKRLNTIKYLEKDFIKKNDKQILNTAIVCSDDNCIVSVMKITKKVNWN